MAIATTTLIAAAALATTAYSISEQKSEAKKAAKAQTAIRQEENAKNKAQQMAERRTQLREERIKRARVIQAAQNSGTAASSGETGAVSSLGTNLGSNLGFNQSMVRSGERMSIFAQQASDAQGRQQSAAMLGSFAQSAAPLASDLATSIFGKTIGGTTKQSNAPIESYYGVK